MSSVIAIAFPVFAVIVLGYLAGRVKLMNEAESVTLNKFVFSIAMPAALFGLTAGTPPPGAKEAALVLAYAIASLTALFGGYAIARMAFRVTEQEGGAHALASTLGNAVFLGLPIAISIDGWPRPFVSMMLVEGTIMIAIASALIAPRRADGSPLKRAFNYLLGPARNPLVIAMILGVIYSACGFSFSGPVETFFSLIGRAAGPTALFSIGLFLATHRFPALGSVAGRVSAIALVKMGLLPGVALSLAHVFGVADPAYLGAIALFTLTPCGVGSYVMASQYGVYSSETAAAVAVTMVLSVFSISTVLAVFA